MSRIGVNTRSGLGKVVYPPVVYPSDNYKQPASSGTDLTMDPFKMKPRRKSRR